MIVDLHIHTAPASTDSNIDRDLLVDAARAAGLDGICITEHGNRRATGTDALAKKHGFPVWSGMEASTELGDILIFGLDEYPREIHRAVDLCRYVRQAGGLMVAAHPFRFDLSPKPWLKRPVVLTVQEACQRQLLHLVDAMEVANGWCVEQDVAFCRQVSDRLGLPATGGSDAHVLKDVGICATVFQNPVATEQDLIREIRAGRCKAADRRVEAQKNPLHLY